MAKTNSIKQLRHSLSELSAIMYKIYVEWWVSEKHVTESEHIACNMYRMMIFKAKSIWLMSKGIIIVRTQKGIIPDPSTMYPVLRSMYELLFLFRCMFASSRNDKERELLIYLWKIKGNNNLVKMPDEELDNAKQSQKESAQDENEKLKSKIWELADELLLSPSITKKIEKQLTDYPALKGFKFDHFEQSANISDFQPLDFSKDFMGMDLSGVSYIYSHYSAHSHPSYLGVKHFEEMYTNKEEDKYVKEILEHSCKYLVRFMREFCEYQDSYRLFYGRRERRINNLMNRKSQD